MGRGERRGSGGVVVLEEKEVEEVMILSGFSTPLRGRLPRPVLIAE